MERATSHLSRRNLLIGAAGAAIVTVVALPTWRPLSGERTRRLLAGNPLTRRFVSLGNAGMREWEAQIGAAFTASGGYRLRLAGVRPLTSRGARPPSVRRRRAFLAVFDIADGRTMASDLIYTLAHADYGPMPLFLTASDSPARMHAVFN
ncbi:MAG: DUF6916 family protein [Allosphingosinicella sp.]